MSNWKTLSLSELASSYPNAIVDGPFGSNLKTSDYVNEGVPVLQGQNITGDRFVWKDVRYITTDKANSLKRSSARPGDLLIVKIGSVGYSAIVDDLGGHDFAIIPANLIKATFDEKRVSTKFIHYHLTSESGKRTLKELAGNTAQPALSLKKVRNISFLYPGDIEEQHHIVAILSALDEQIEKTEALVEKLLLQRTGVVQQSLLTLARESETFDLGTLASLITSGSRGWGKYYSEHGALFLRIGNLTREHPNLRLNDVVRVKVPAGGEGERTRVQEGDLLISITADLGIVGCIPAGFEEAYVNQHIALVRIDSGKVHPRWVAHVLGSPYGVEQFLALNATGAKAGLNLPSVRRLSVPCPTMKKQMELVGALDSLDVALGAERKYLHKLRLQKAGLMRDLLTGNVQVKEMACR